MVSLGHKIRNARIKKNLTINDAAKATKIRAEFLTAIEKGQYNKLPEKTYAYGFVRNYIEFLGMPKEETLALFRREFDEEKVFKVLPEGLSRESNFNASTFYQNQRIILIFLFFLVVFGYILFQYRFAIFAPPLDLNSPNNGEILSSSHILISGRTDPSASVYVNDNLVFVNEKGQFEKQIDLFSGKTKITVKAVNRFGKETIVERNIEIKNQ